MAVNVEEKFKASSGTEKVLLIFGGVCFVIMAVFVLFHLGFVDETMHSSNTPMEFLSRRTLWYINLGLGVVGGILLDIKHPLIGACSGMLAAFALTGSGLLYMGWRETILSVELIIPMLVALFVGVPINRFLKLIFKRRPD